MYKSYFYQPKYQYETTSHGNLFTLDGILHPVIMHSVDHEHTFSTRSLYYSLWPTTTHTIPTKPHHPPDRNHQFGCTLRQIATAMKNECDEGGAMQRSRFGEEARCAVVVKCIDKFVARLCGDCRLVSTPPHARPWLIYENRECRHILFDHLLYIYIVERSFGPHGKPGVSTCILFGP